jgi:hypothetical protein
LINYRKRFEFNTKIFLPVTDIKDAFIQIGYDFLELSHQKIINSQFTLEIFHSRSQTLSFTEQQNYFYVNNRIINQIGYNNLLKRYFIY